MGKFHYWGPGFGANPADDGEADRRDAIRGELKGSDIADAIGWDVALSNKMDALLSLVAAGANDDCDHGRKLRELVEAAVEVAIDERAGK